MSDDPNKKHVDGRFVSWQAHEISYVVGILANEFPYKSRSQIEAALNACKTSIQPSEGRDKLMACARARLRA